MLLASSFFNLHIFVFGVILINKISIGYAKPMKTHGPYGTFQIGGDFKEVRMSKETYICVNESIPLGTFKPWSGNFCITLFLGWFRRFRELDMPPFSLVDFVQVM